MQTLAPELTWTGERFERDLAVTVDEGRIVAVEPGGSADAVSLSNRALLPGFCNVHSHAFQRGLRGLGERFPKGSGSFWSWREAMYELVEALDVDRIYELSLRAFDEMLDAGMTSVGEFHYVHHAGDPPHRERNWALDEPVVAAAREAGIRLCLLQTYYRTGGIGKPLEGAQLRFDGGSPDEYWKAFDELSGHASSPLVSMGCVVHSLRGSDLADLRAMHAEATRRDLVFHMHLEEQRREVQDCRDAYGRPPLAVVLDELDVDERFTCVHGTHATTEDLERFRAAGANLCIAPTTEASLGDGIPELDDFLAKDGHLSLGSDSNVRISMLEEMRWLEYAQRLKGEKRGVVVDGDGNSAARLLRGATEGGARALGSKAGKIAPGHLADFVSIDLEAKSLVGWREETLADSIVFGADEDAIEDVCVGGVWRGARK